jgi:hypothetical protein
MSSALIPTAEAIETIVEMIRTRLTEARANGQKVRMHAKESTRSQRFSASEPIPSFAQLLSGADKDGGFDLTISIEPRRPGQQPVALEGAVCKCPAGLCRCGHHQQLPAAKEVGGSDFVPCKQGHKYHRSIVAASACDRGGD